MPGSGNTTRAITPHPTDVDPDLVVPVHDALAQLGPGAAIARYVVLERIGQGAMGVVFAAYDPDLDRKVAIKLLQLEESSGGGSLGRARLLREAQALARLTHPNVVVVHDVGTFEGRVFVAMEFVRGQTLTEHLSRHTLDRDAIVSLFVQAGRGLAAAHAVGLLHRDFKPDNVMVGDDGRVRVLDFGLARTADATALPEAEIETDPPPELRSDPGLEPRERGPEALAATAAAPGGAPGLYGSAGGRNTARSGRVDVRITRTGAMAGTPAYMAPEQHRGLPLDARADQFAFCVALWEALAGERPFAGRDRFALALAVCSGQRRAPPAEARMPASLRRALERGLEVEPARRFADMDALLAALQPRRSRAPLLASVGALALGGAAIAWVGGGGDGDGPRCDRAGDPAQSAWSDARAQTVAQRFEAVGGALGEQTATRVAEGLSRYAQGWSAAAQDACRATHERGEQSAALLDRRSSCLRTRLVALQGLADRFEQADASAVQRAADAVVALPALDRCSDTAALLAAVAPPEDPAVVAEVEAIRDALGAAEIDGRLGHYADAYARMPELRRRARATGYRAIAAEVDVTSGDLASAAGFTADAQRQLVDAAHAALAAGDDALFVRAATELVTVVGVGLSHYDEGLAWAGHAAAGLEREGGDTAQQAALAEAVCEVLADKAEPTFTLAQCMRATELAVAHWGPDDLRTAQTYEALGIGYVSAARYAEAQEQFERVRAIVLRDKGDVHPDAVQIDNALAATCFYQHGAAPCLPRFREVVRVAERALGPEHETVADLTNNLAILLENAGALDEAEQRAQAALALRRAASGDAHPGIAASLAVLAAVDHKRGALAQAAARYDEAVAIYEKTRGEAHPDVVRTLQSAGEVRLALGEREQARARLDRALALATTLARPESELAALRALQAQAASTSR
ncbi:MAG: serine/threonine-protein kinase [Nannocystaceae bacterium]|nr:serine/threonine-protein kinase [Nannocystaceae bacterium]